MPGVRTPFRTDTGPGPHLCALPLNGPRDRAVSQADAASAVPRFAHPERRTQVRGNGQLVPTLGVRVIKFGLNRGIRTFAEMYWGSR